MLLAFVSDLFVIGGDTPLWLERLGWLSPLKHFSVALTDAFDPFGSGSGFASDRLTVMALWGAAGLLVAARFFRWEPRPAWSADVRRTGHVRRAAAPRSTLRLVIGQVRYADAVLWRDPGAWFFGLVFPALLLVLLPTTVGDDVRISGVSMAQHLAAGMPVYAIAVVAYVVQASAVAKARDRGVLKRLGGTPLPAWANVAGRVGSTLWLSPAATVLMLALGGRLVRGRDPTGCDPRAGPRGRGRRRLSGSGRSGCRRGGLLVRADRSGVRRAASRNAGADGGSR